MVLHKTDLIKICKIFGLSYDGDRAELELRIKYHLNRVAIDSPASAISAASSGYATPMAIPVQPTIPAQPTIHVQSTIPVQPTMPVQSPFSGAPASSAAAASVAGFSPSASRDPICLSCRLPFARRGEPALRFMIR